MKIRIKISKTQLLKLVAFAMLVGVAFILDNYFEKNPVKIAEGNTPQGHNTKEPGTVYFYTQSTTFSAKTSVQKTPDQKLFQLSHNKLLQKYHQLRNYQVLKNDAQNLKKPFFLTHHFLAFRNYFYSFPDDVPIPA